MTLTDVLPQNCRRLNVISCILIVVVLPQQALITQETPRSIVPIVCMDTTVDTAATRPRGTGIVVDTKGLLITAAHVITNSSKDCGLIALVPSDIWSKASGFLAFSLLDCVTSLPLDLSVCHMRPARREKDWEDLYAANLTALLPEVDSEISVAGFPCASLFPVLHDGKLKTKQLYKRENGPFSDFSTDIIAVGGMSGSPMMTKPTGEVIGIITTAGEGPFSAFSYGTSIQAAKEFLRDNGVALDSRQ